MTDTNKIGPKQCLMIALSGVLAASSYLIPLPEETAPPGLAQAEGGAGAPPARASQPEPVAEPEPAIELAVPASRPATLAPLAAPPVDLVDAAEPGNDARPSAPIIEIPTTILGPQDFLADPAIGDSVRLLPVDQKELVSPLSAVQR